MRIYIGGLLAALQNANVHDDQALQIVNELHDRSDQDEMSMLRDKMARNRAKSHDLISAANFHPASCVPVARD